jgi:hypothetical protein
MSTGSSASSCERRAVSFGLVQRFRGVNHVTRTDQTCRTRCRQCNRRAPRLRGNSGICWRLFGMLVDLEPYRVRPCPRNRVGSGNRPLIRPAVGHPRDETFSGRAFFPALYGGTFGGMTSAFGLSDSASGRSATLTFTLVIVLSIVCGVAFFVVAKLDARSTVSDCVQTRGQIRGHRDFGFLPVHSFGRPHGRGR